jgi:GSCFA family.
VEFKTTIKIEKPSFQFSHTESILLMGSCFAENIGQELSKRFFSVDINPFGTLYNPSSIAKSLWILIEEKLFDERELFEHEGLFHSFMHHSRFSSVSAKESLSAINSRLAVSSQQIKTMERLILTFGTAWVYRLGSTKEVVANCHKLPEKIFTRSRLSVDEITDEWRDLLISLWKINPKLKVLFTVSPIRHWKDGANGNQLSKATLLLAIDKLCKSFPEQTEYFPSYEIMIDELRDYRFYASDMLHPSPMAIEYIWERFSESFIRKETINILKDLSEVQKAVDHRPFNPNSGQYKKFLLNTINKAELINNNIQSAVLTDTINELRGRVSNLL